MSVTKIDFTTFHTLRQEIPVIDVRTPAEFEQGHIPGAYNIPIFTNEERAIIGTLYKKSGKETAVEKGLGLVGPKLATFVKQGKKIAKNKKLIVHCWRGGMRSASMAWLFNTAGLTTQVLEGGYKTYRGALKNLFSEEIPMIIVGGFTGSGKTDFLKALEKRKYQIIDLEGIAHHKGSAFGHIGEQKQPSTEQFENNLFEHLLSLDFNQTIYLEDESRNVGSAWISDAFFKQMRKAPVLKLNVPENIRLDRLVKDYANTEQVKEALIFSVNKIKKRLGGLRTQNSIELINEGNFKEAAKKILPYYDKTYAYGLSQRDKNSIIEFDILENNMDIAAENYLQSTTYKNLSKLLKINHE